jgi:hypothetical protein
MVNGPLVSTGQDLAEWHTTVSYAFLISKRRVKLFENKKCQKKIFHKRLKNGEYF